MEYLFTSESLISFLILVVLEVVLGIDNVIFVSIIMNRLKLVRSKMLDTTTKRKLQRSLTSSLWNQRLTS